MKSSYKSFQLLREGQLLQISSSFKRATELNANRQNFPDTFVGNGYVDVLSVDVMKKQK